ncbi:MAG: iron-sulfur cluster repair di-iron protein [Phycisphaerales bacterium]|nr:iron-sulfur cluster repair di-iron protein [Phycisphaerales bacterium]
MTVTIETPVGEIASTHPLSTRVFARHHIDFCCGGGAPLEVACKKRGLDANAVLEEIETELEGVDEEPTRWTDAPLTDLIEYIVSTYHKSLREELPRLEAMALRVNEVHGDKDPERLQEIVAVFQALKTELTEHMMKEEQILFPMIAKGDRESAQETITLMEDEHESAGNSLERLRELTDDYTPPLAACNTWRALWHGLEVLEKDTHQHIHLENNILFPRALQA